MTRDTDESAPTKFRALVADVAVAMWDFAYPNCWDPGLDEVPLEDVEQAMEGARVVLAAIEAAGYEITRRPPQTASKGVDDR